MKLIRRMSALVALAAAVPLTAMAPVGASVAGPAAAQPTAATLVAIRAGHHPGYDRVVFEFRGGLPDGHQVSYVPQLVGDPSGLPVRVAGRAILQARFSPARAHDDLGAPTVSGRTTYDLPNVLTTVRSGDFEAVTTYGIGLAKRTRVHVFTLHHPARVVVDVRAAFRTLNRRVWFFDQSAFLANQQPFFTPRVRPVRADRPVVGRLDRLFAGVLPGEYAAGLRLLRSEATGFRLLSISDGVARVQLTGGCASGGSTATVAGELMPTLRRLADVSWVKIYDPQRTTERPTGHSDSVPTCLEP